MTQLVLLTRKTAAFSSLRMRPASELLRSSRLIDEPRIFVKGVKNMIFRCRDSSNHKGLNNC